MSYKPIFRHELNGKKVAIFGAGKTLETLAQKNPELADFLANTVCVIDNNPQKQGKRFWIQGYVIPCVSFDEFTEKYFDENTVILIPILDYENIAKQIDDYKNGIIPWDMIRLVICDPEPYTFKTALDHPVIPKTIHYCWFGGNPIPEQLQNCIDSWSKFCPDYEIVRWDESNYDVNKNAYMKTGFDNKIWSLVSDYARADIIYKYGGIYLDTDVELIRGLDDLRCNEAYYGFEHGPGLANGLGYGCVKGHETVAEMLEAFECENVVESIFKEHTIYQMEILNRLMQKRGFRIDNTMQIKDGIALYPSDVLSPTTVKIYAPSYYPIHSTQNTYSVHHYETSHKGKLSFK